MTVEVAIIGGMSAVMFLFAYSAFKFAEQKGHEIVALFSYLISLVLAWGVTAASFRLIKNNQPPLTGIGQSFWWAVVVAGCMILVYFVLRVMIWPMIAAKKKKRFELE